MNAISRKLLDEFNDYITKLKIGHSDVTDIGALILTSSSAKVFCAGADLKERKTFTLDDTSAFLEKLNGTLDMVSNLRIPTITAIEGLALGGGLEIALSTDFRVLSERAQVGLTETRLAIVPGAGGTYRLPRLIGYNRALDMVLTGRRVPASEALQFGIANRVGANADDEAIKLADDICSGGPLAILAAKEAVRGSAPQWEKNAYRQVVNSEDKFEALDAFAAKRKPVFKGK
jgi:methylglutaconyl-CoA hydratase